jgi:hypothetical protein
MSRKMDKAISVDILGVIRSGIKILLFIFFKHLLNQPWDHPTSTKANIICHYQQV